jgi:signal transduction histidine kinase
MGMSFFGDRSIKVKLMLLLTTTATIALFVACGALWIYEAFDYLATLERESDTIVTMLASSSSAAIAFSDANAANEMLASLRAEPRIMKACIYGTTGYTLATYARAPEDIPCPFSEGVRSMRVTRSSLLIHSPVMLDGVAIGELFVDVSLAEMYHHLARLAGICFAVLLAASFIAVTLSFRWQRLISTPIIHLTRVAGQVSADANYSIRAERSSNDEVGVLIDQFNAMMEQINRRDSSLKEAQDKLETRVEERTSELLNEIAERKLVEQDLLHAKLEAETSNRSKSEFLANMSHELRTPLNAVIGYSEMLEEDAVETTNLEAASDLRRIQTAGRHLLSLVNDILDLSKIEAGKFDLTMEQVLASEIVGQVIQTIEPVARKSGSRLLVKPDNWNGLICVDKAKFHQSLLNLLSNAFKFSENGVVTLAIESRQESGRDWILWHVQDTGIGIPEKDIDKLFQVFSQVDSSATRRYGGTGLGLAISQRFCRMMGGFITVKSVLSEGSTFTIHIPRDNEGNQPERLVSIG